MQFDNPMTFVRSLKGAPISILVAFMINRHAMTALELQQWTGYKGDNITAAVRLLEVEGWLSARSPRGPWCLVEGRQMPLMADSDLIGFSPTTTTTNGRLNLNKSNVVVAVRTTPIKSELQVYLEGLGIPVEANLKACKLYGIGEPMATQISELKHVTPDFIAAHVRSLVQGETKGLAIVRIRSDEMPRMWQDEIDELMGVNYYEFKAARKAGKTLDEYAAEHAEESDEE